MTRIREVAARFLSDIAVFALLLGRCADDYHFITPAILFNTAAAGVRRLSR